MLFQTICRNHETSFVRISKLSFGDSSVELETNRIECRSLLSIVFTLKIVSLVARLGITT